MRSAAPPTAEECAPSLRDELRGERAGLLRRLEGVEQDVDQWRRSYWQVVEEREGLKAQNRALSLTVDSLTAELAAVNKRADDLEVQVEALKEQLARTQVGAESESVSVPVR